MGRISTGMLLFANRLFPRLRIHDQLESSKLRAHDYFYSEMEEGRHVLADFADDATPADKVVLDLGSGLGGKTCLYAQEGARVAIGLDIRLASIRQAQQLVRDGSVECERYPAYLLGDGARIPLEDETIDLVVSVNVFEHLAEPSAALGECARVLRCGGKVLVRFSPWYSPWGPHLNRWINLPWPHLLFSEATLIEAANAIEDREHRNDNLIETAKMNLRGLERLPELNRLTIAQFRRLLRRVPLSLTALRLLPVGYESLQRSGWWGVATLKLLYVMTRLPLLREVVTTKIVCVLTKQEGDSFPRADTGEASQGCSTML